MWFVQAFLDFVRSKDVTLGLLKPIEFWHKESHWVRIITLLFFGIVITFRLPMDLGISTQLFTTYLLISDYVLASMNTGLPLSCDWIIRAQQNCPLLVLHGWLVARSRERSHWKAGVISPFWPIMTQSQKHLDGNEKSHLTNQLGAQKSLQHIEANALWINAKNSKMNHNE